MNIALNLHFLRPSVTGGGETYAIELLRALASLDWENRYLLFCNHDGYKLDLPEQGNFHIITGGGRASVRPLRYAWEQLVMPVQLRGRNLDFVHSMGYVSPLLAPMKQIVTIPDANWEDLDTMSPARRVALGFFARRSAAAAEVIITGTQAAADRLKIHLPAKRGRIAVVPLGADHLPQAVACACLAGIQNPYVIAIGGGVPHKNIPRLIHAFAQIAGKIPHQLVIAGLVSPETRGAAEVAGLGERLHFTGFVDDDLLAQLFASADLFVFPTWHEGFGLPLIEAQRFGTPVAAASIPALVEISNGTAELFDPYSIDAISNSLLRILTNPAQRSALANVAAQNSARYTWEVTARATLDIYREVFAAACSPRL